MVVAVCHRLEVQMCACMQSVQTTTYCLHACSVCKCMHAVCADACSVCVCEDARSACSCVQLQVQCAGADAMCSGPGACIYIYIFCFPVRRRDAAGSRHHPTQSRARSIHGDAVAIMFGWDVLPAGRSTGWRTRGSGYTRIYRHDVSLVGPHFHATAQPHPTATATTACSTGACSTWCTTSMAGTTGA